MLQEISGAIIAFLTTLVSNYEKLIDKKKPKSLAPIILIIASMIGCGIQLMTLYNSNAKLKEVNKVFEDSSAVLFSEASGGTVIGDAAYIVDDELPRLFKLRLNGDDKKYKYKDTIDLYDNGKKLEEDDVDDLEAIASAPALDEKSPENIYLITSHSNTKKGKVEKSRQKLIEVELTTDSKANVKRIQENLRKSISDKLTEISKAHGDKNLEKIALQLEDDKTAEDEVEKGLIQIEGFAIDRKGNAYFGFRTPLVKIDGGPGYALLLIGNFDDLFSSAPKLDYFLLDLKDGGICSGICSIDYDVQSETLLIIGNDPSPENNKPILWQLDIVAREKEIIQLPKKLGPIIYGTGGQQNFGRPELLLLPSKDYSDKIYTFLDTNRKGKGGQIVMNRRAFQLN